MTKFYLFWRTQTAAVSLSYFHLELNAGITYLAWANSETNRHTEQILTIAKFEDKSINSFLLGVVLKGRIPHCISSLLVSQYRAVMSITYSTSVYLASLYSGIHQWRKRKRTQTQATRMTQVQTKFDANTSTSEIIRNFRHFGKLFRR